MSRLIVVRHGQASFFAENYDQLSPLGVEQARMLGAYWAKLGFQPDRVVVGPKVRHQQTEAAVAAVFAEHGTSWPAAEKIPCFDEHQGAAVVRYVLEQEGGSHGRDLKAYFKKYREVTRAWVAGSIEAPGIEPWIGFESRVKAALNRLRQNAASSTVTVVFSSGGPLAVTAAWALGLGSSQALKLSLPVNNGAFTEVWFNAHELSLACFNSTPHFTRPECLTKI